MVQIQIGSEEYTVNVKKIPYLEAFLRFQQHAGQDTAQLPTHDKIPFFDVINHAMEHGFRHFFRRMPTDLSDYHTLCETLEFLAVDVLEEQKITDVMSDMRRGKTEYDPEDGREVSGGRSVARDSAFRLLYLFMLGEFESDVRDQNAAYNAALFVVSHCGIFKWKTRKMVREAFEERFSITEKQRQSLDKWPIEARYSASSDDDETTEDEDYNFYDSDFSF